MNDNRNNNKHGEAITAASSSASSTSTTRDCEIDDFYNALTPTTAAAAAASSFDETKAKMQQLQDRYNQKKNDDGMLELLRHVEQITLDMEQQQQEMIQQTSDIQKQLQQDLNESCENRKTQSKLLQDMEMALRELKGDCCGLQENLLELEQTKTDLQHRIALHQKDVNHEIQEYEIIEEQQKMEVPRLKHQISLYATTTGIKWDYPNDDDEQNNENNENTNITTNNKTSMKNFDYSKLQGHVNVPSQETVRSFALDHKQLSRYDIANSLWNIMEGE